MKKDFLKVQLGKLKADYRHIICWSITAISLSFAFLFPNSLPRLAEALRDLATSLAYYVCEIFTRSSNPIYPTVMDMPSWQFTEQIWQPLHLLPYMLEEFEIFMDKFWTLFFTKEHFAKYWIAFGDFLFYSSRILLDRKSVV